MDFEDHQARRLVIIVTLQPFAALMADGFKFNGPRIVAVIAAFRAGRARPCWRVDWVWPLTHHGQSPVAC